MNEKFDNLQINLTLTNEQKENIFLKRSLSYFQLKNYEFSERDSIDCLKLNPTNYLAHYFLCLIKLRKGKYLEALKHSEDSLKNYEKIIPFENSFEFEELRKSLSTPIEEEEKNFDWNTTTIVESVGNFFSNFGKIEEVEKKEIKRIIKFEKLEFLYGNCLIQNEFYEDGISYFKDLIQSSKSSKIGFYYFLIGSSYYHIYDKINAEKYFNLSKKENYNQKSCDLMIFMVKKSSMKEDLKLKEIESLKKK